MHMDSLIKLTKEKWLTLKLSRVREDPVSYLGEIVNFNNVFVMKKFPQRKS